MFCFSRGEWMADVTFPTILSPMLSGQKENRIVDEDDISTRSDGLPGG